jgi:mono/diheme cytochrome c family protein
MKMLRSSSKLSSVYIKRNNIDWLTVVIATVVMNMIATDHVIAAESNTSPANQKSDNNLIERGAYLAKMGDCVACHTIPDGQEFGGGLAFITPFGTMYSTNISSDKDHGIGHYSYDDFYSALHDGIAPKGNLYPAMPYTSYRLLTDDDTRALYAFFMDTKPVQQKNKDNDVGFPFNIRMGLKGWSLINLESELFQPVPGKSEAWNKGNYIVNALGHCGECHTPRGTLFAMDQSKQFEGAMIEGYEASNITPTELNRQGWTAMDLEQLLRTGYSRKGTVFGGMYPVVYHSLSHLTTDDMAAVTTYLLDTDSAVSDVVEPAALTFNGHDESAPGYRLYNAYCAGCHGVDGEGKPNISPAMAGNSTLDQAEPINTVAVLLNGVGDQRYSQTQSFYAMPGYRNEMDKQQLTDLINYLQKTWTTQKGELTQEKINMIISKVEESLPDAAH